MTNYNFNTTLRSKALLFSLLAGSYTFAFLSAISIPIYYFFILAFIICLTYHSGDLRWKALGLFFLFVIYLGPTEIDKRYSLFLMYVFIIIFGLVGTKIPYRVEHFDKFLIIALCAIVLISSIGLYRYVFGYNVSISENVYGFFQERIYPYFGIRYSNSSRNTDLYFISIGFCLSFYLGFLSKIKPSIVFKIIFIFLCILMPLSLSRSYYLLMISFLLILFLLKHYRLFFMSFIIIVSSYFFSLNSVDYFKNLIINQKSQSNVQQVNKEMHIKKLESASEMAKIGSESIYDTEAATSKLDNSIQFSNDYRINLATITIKEILNSPTGHDFDVPTKALSDFTGLKIIHSENIHLDNLYNMGFIYLFFIIYFIYITYKLFLLSRNQVQALPIVFISVFSMIYSNLNSPINLGVYWLSIALVIFFYNSVLKENKNEI